MKNGKSFIKIAAVVFMIIGLCGVVAGLLLLSWTFWIAAFVLGAISLVFLLAGMICFCVYIIPKRWKERLLNDNEYVMAEVVDIEQNLYLEYQVDQIMLHPFVIYCRYTDQRGNRYDFKSRPLLYNPSGLMKEQTLKVYVNLQKPGRYLVDTDSILPSNAILHKFRVIWNGEGLKERGQYVVATTCGVELIGQIIVKGCLKPMQLKVSEEAAKQFDIPRDSKNRMFMGYTVLCRYEAPDGVTHIFASKGCWGEPGYSYMGEQVRVYYQGNNYSRYYVALEEIKKDE